MNSYEAVFILTPVLSEDQAKEAVQAFDAKVKELGGKVSHNESWGLKKLAYPIQKKSTGFYFLSEFSAPGSAIAEIELMFKRDERVMRFLTVKMEKDHLAYAEKRRARLSGAKKPTEVEA